MGFDAASVLEESTGDLRSATESGILPCARHDGSARALRGAAGAADRLTSASAGVTLEGATLTGAPCAVLLERAIAEGGVGVVYAGRLLADGRAVAVKVLRARHAADVGLTSRFDREIRYGFRLRHPNVVSVLAAGRTADGRPFLVMDLLQGDTLGALIRSGGPLSLARGLRVAEQLLAGLAAVHEAGIVHRDLQPDNVLLAEGAGRERAMILDFGFAQEPGVDVGDGATADSPGSLVGTLRFMSPEQAIRGRAITARSDLFAVAVLLYYAFSGKIPFRGSDDLDVLVSVVRAAPVPLRRARRDVPRRLDEILARALAKHPDARFASAREMRAALLTVEV
jgi:serine/threonine-protein kinase